MFWEITCDADTAINLNDETLVSFAGRVLSFRRSGGIAFGHISDTYGKIQFCLKKQDFENYLEICQSIKIGCHLGIAGKMWTSSTGERTILCNQVKVLQTPTRGFPDKWAGITDKETQIRKRYLDTTISPEKRSVFFARSQIISSIRSFLNEYSFMEVETPVLSTTASGALARPFKTHHNALDTDLYMRIAPETFLKRMVGGGFDFVYEIGKQFRNEGMSPSHLQEFTSLEWYAAYYDYKDNCKLFQELIEYIVLVQTKSAGLNITYQGIDLDFSKPTYITYAELFKQHLDIDVKNTVEDLDLLFKKHIRPKLIQPTYVIDYPAHMAPLSAANQEGNAEMWQYIVNGWELVKCYTELTDPVLQRKNFEEQQKSKGSGNEEAMATEEEFLEAMEYGMPPMSGLGLGIDRLVAILTDSESIRDVVYFPIIGAK